MTCNEKPARKLPIPEILNIALNAREAGIGEIIIEYKLSEVPDTGISGTIVFLRPIQDKYNFPPVKLKYPQRGNLSTNDIHYTFLPPKRGNPTQVQILIPMYVTYSVGIATYRLHEHSDDIITQGTELTLDDIGTLDLSEIKVIKKTFPEKLELARGGTLRIEEEPTADPGPTYLSQASQDAVQRYRLSETFIDSLTTSRYLDLDKCQNIQVTEDIDGVHIKIDDTEPHMENIQLINGLKSAGEPTTFVLPTPLETADVFKFNYLTWVGKDVNVYVATGYGIGDVTENENFRKILPNEDIKSKEKEDTLNIRVDFLTKDAYIKNVILYYSRIEPAIIITKPFTTQSNFNQAAIFIDTDDLANVVTQMSNDNGRTFVDPQGSEGLDYFVFPTASNKAILKIQMFGDSFIEGYAINTGLLAPPTPLPIDGPNPIEL